MLIQDNQRSLFVGNYLDRVLELLYPGCIESLEGGTNGCCCVTSQDISNLVLAFLQGTLLAAGEIPVGLQPQQVLEGCNACRCISCVTICKCGRMCLGSNPGLVDVLLQLKQGSQVLLESCTGRAALAQAKT